MCKSYTLFLATFTTLLIVPMSITKSEEINHHGLESWGSTDVKIANVKYTWIINNYKFCCQNVGDIIRSPIFSTKDGCEWFVDIRPKGDSEKDKDYVALFVSSINCNCSAVVKLSILNAKGKQTNIKEFSHQYQLKQLWGYNRYILQSNLLSGNNDYLSGNHLTIICEITIKLGIENSVGKLLQPKRHLGKDFGLLLENEVLSDVTLTASGSKFKAHKAILVARSPVFEARFQNGAENDTLAELANIDPKALKAMLHYIYTDEDVCDSAAVAPKLLIAAVTYELDGLKNMCETTLRTNLAIYNAVDFFVLADKYCAVELKKEALKFIVNHASDVANTTGFKSLILTQPRLAAEAFDLFG